MCQSVLLQVESDNTKLTTSMLLQRSKICRAPDFFVKVTCQTLSVSEGRLVGRSTRLVMQLRSLYFGGVVKKRLIPPASSP